MTTARRSRVLGTVLAATLAACAWLASRPDAAVVDAVGVVRQAVLSSATTAIAAPRPAWPGDVLRDQSAAGAEGHRGGAWPLLGKEARAAWAAPVAAPIAAVPALPASAVVGASPPPRFPFTLIGRWEGEAPAASPASASRRLVLLAGQQRTYAVGAGDVVDGQWRIERVAAESFTVTWLPQGRVLTVSFAPS